MRLYANILELEYFSNPLLIKNIEEARIIYESIAKIDPTDTLNQEDMKENREILSSHFSESAMQ